MAKVELIDSTITTMIEDYEKARKNMKEIDKYFKRLKLKVQWSLSTKAPSQGCWGMITGVVHVEGDAAEKAAVCNPVEFYATHIFRHHTISKVTIRIDIDKTK